MCRTMAHAVFIFAPTIKHNTMKLLFNIVYYLVVGFALYLLMFGLMPDWSESKFLVQYAGTIILVCLVLGIIRGILYERKMRKVKKSAIEEEDDWEYVFCSSSMESTASAKYNCQGPLK